MILAGGTCACEITAQKVIKKYRKPANPQAETAADKAVGQAQPQR